MSFHMETHAVRVSTQFTIARHDRSNAQARRVADELHRRRRDFFPHGDFVPGPVVGGQFTGTYTANADWAASGTNYLLVHHNPIEEHRAGRQPLVSLGQYLGNNGCAFTQTAQNPVGNPRILVTGDVDLIERMCRPRFDGAMALPLAGPDHAFVQVHARRTLRGVELEFPAAVYGVGDRFVPHAQAFLTAIGNLPHHAKDVRINPSPTMTITESNGMYAVAFDGHVLETDPAAIARGYVIRSGAAFHIPLNNPTTPAHHLSLNQVEQILGFVHDIGEHVNIPRASRQHLAALRQHFGGQRFEHLIR